MKYKIIKTTCVDEEKGVKKNQKAELVRTGKNLMGEKLYLLKHKNWTTANNEWTFYEEQIVEVKK